MEVQSLSIVVPAKCPNRCPFCVSHMNKENKKFKPREMDELLQRDIYKRMKFARDNGTNTLMITSTGEATQNWEYVKWVLDINRSLPNPFDWIELQTSGVGLISEGMFDLHEFSTVSLSVVDIFDDKNNQEIMKMSFINNVYLKNTIDFLKKLNINVRLSINLTNIYDDKVYSPHPIFERLKELGVDQVTFRKLYYSGENTKQDKWIKENKLDDMGMLQITEYVKAYGRPLERLPFGAMKYSVDGISTVVDDDCMNNKEVKEVMKYLILRPDGKLYSKWDDKGSLIF